MQEVVANYFKGVATVGNKDRFKQNNKLIFIFQAKDEIYKLLVRTTGQAWSITLPADRIPSVWFSFAFAWKRSLGLAVYLNGFKVSYIYRLVLKH